MTALITRPVASGAASDDTPFTLADIGGMAVIAFYFTLKFGPFEQLYFPHGFMSTAVLPGLAIAVLAITPGSAIGKAPVSLSLIAVLAWSTMSVAWSVNQTFTLFLIRSELPALILTMLVVGSMRLELVTKTLVGYVQVIVVWSIFMSVTRVRGRVSSKGQGIDDLLVGWRGTFDHKNGLGMFLVFGIATVLAFEHRRVVRPLTIALCVTGVVGCRSATAASGMLVLGLTWAWLSALSVSRNKRDQAIFAILSVMVGALAVFLTLGLLPSFLDLYGKDLTFSGRTIIWSNTLDVVAQRPLLGVGFTGNWSNVLAPVVDEVRRSIGFDAAHAHNGAIELLFEVGVVGLVLYLIFYAGTVRQGMRCLESANPYGRWAVATCAALAIMSVSEVLFQGAFLGYLAVVWVVITRADRVASLAHGRP